LSIDPRSYIISRFPDAHVTSSGRIHTKCPFHDDRSPSFSIDVNRGVFICGSSKCGLKGNFPKFYKLCENITWAEVFQKLGSKELFDSVDELLSKINSRQNQQVTYCEIPYPPEECLDDVHYCDYLKDRDLDPQTLRNFGVRYGLRGNFSNISISNSLVAPVFDINGRYWTFQVRYLGTGMRWKNPVGSNIHSLLYGGWYISDGDYLFVVEGPSDVWKMSQFGLNAVGLFTKRASDSQLNRIKVLCQHYDLTPVVMLDGDASVTNEKGENSAESLYYELSAYGLSPKIVYLDYKEDPGSISRERIDQVLSSL